MLFITHTNEDYIVEYLSPWPLWRQLYRNKYMHKHIRTYIHNYLPIYLSIHIHPSIYIQIYSPTHTVLAHMYFIISASTATYAEAAKEIIGNVTSSNCIQPDFPTNFPSLSSCFCDYFHWYFRFIHGYSLSLFPQCIWRCHCSLSVCVIPELRSIMALFLRVFNCNKRPFA